MMFLIMFLVMATMIFLVTLMKMSPACVADGGRTCRQRVFGLLPFNMNDANNTLIRTKSTISDMHNTLPIQDFG